MLTIFRTGIDIKYLVLNSAYQRPKLVLTLRNKTLRPTSISLYGLY